MSTYFLTDSHLGNGADSAQREKDLVAFLDSIENDCERLILLGDMFDFWFSYKYVVPRGYIRLLGKLAQMADKGVEIHYFIGNHDMWMFDYLEKEIGIIMHSDPVEMTLGGKRFLIGHGDGVGGLDKYYLMLRRIFRCRFNQRLFAIMNPGVGFRIALRWSNSSRRSHGRKYEEYLGDGKEDIVVFCHKQLRLKDYDYFVFGHRHLPINKVIEEPACACGQQTEDRKATYVNVGNWIDRRDYAVFDGSTLQQKTFTP